MKENFKQSIVNQLMGMRSTIDAMLYLLSEAEKEERECNHPKEYRINYTTMGGKEHWECELCGYEYKEGEGEN